MVVNVKNKKRNMVARTKKGKFTSITHTKAYQEEIERNLHNNVQKKCVDMQTRENEKLTEVSQSLET